MTNKSSDWVRFGVVGRPHGVKGAVKIHLENPDSDTLRKGLVVRTDDTERTIDSVNAGAVVFEGVNDRDAAAALTHAVVFVQREDFHADDDDDFLVDLVGRAVVDVAGVSLGTLTGFITSGPQLLAEVKPDKSAIVLVPFVEPIVQALGPPIVLAPPSGLFDDDAIDADSEDSGEDT